MIHSHTSTFGSTPFSCFVPTPADQRYSIEAAQLEVWLASQQSEDANCAYNEIATLTFNGPLNRSALDLAIQSIYQRHGSLRATFDRHGREVIERASAQLNIESRDWRHDEPRQIDELRRQLIDQLGRTPFDLEHGPLFRAIVQCESETRHYLTIVAHHWSSTVGHWLFSLRNLARLMIKFKAVANRIGIDRRRSMLTTLWLCTSTPPARRGSEIWLIGSRNLKMAYRLWICQSRAIVWLFIMERCAVMRLVESNIVCRPAW